MKKYEKNTKNAKNAKNRHFWEGRVPPLPPPKTHFLAVFTEGKNTNFSDFWHFSAPPENRKKGVKNVIFL